MARNDKIIRVECGLRRGEGWVERREREDGSIVFASRWYDGSGKARKLQYHPHAHPYGADEQDTIDQAADHNRAVARQKRRGTYRAPTRMTVKELVDRFMERNRGDWSGNTYYTNTGRAKAMIDPHLGNRELMSLTNTDIQEWVDHLKASGYKPKPIHGAASILKGALKSAFALKQIPSNPFEGVKLPTIHQPKHNTWSPDEIAQVLQHVEGNPTWRALYRVALITGCRPGELIGLRWKNVNLAASFIDVEHSRTRTETGKWIVGETTKTKRPRRVPIEETCIEALKRLEQDQAERRETVPSWRDEGFVFAGRPGNKLSINTWRRYQDQMIDQLGITRITLHELRHTNATIELAAGTNVKIVSERLGHKDPQTTILVYSHVSPLMHQEAAADLGRRLFGGSDTTTSPEK